MIRAILAALSVSQVVSSYLLHPVTPLNGLSGFSSRARVVSSSRCNAIPYFPIDDECELVEMGWVPRERLPGPSPDIDAEGSVKICMDCLLSNNNPRPNAGLEVCFDFSSDRCRAAQGGSLEAFISHASNPTFGSMVNAKEWNQVSKGPIIAGTPNRGAMQTVLVDVKPSSGRDRCFLWTLQLERRPPRKGCWLVHECIFVDNAYALTL